MGGEAGGARGRGVQRDGAAKQLRRGGQRQGGNSTKRGVLRYDLIHHMYSEDELRELADGAGIQHARITKMQTLRERLAQHFAELLPERDDA